MKETYEDIFSPMCSIANNVMSSVKKKTKNEPNNKPSQLCSFCSDQDSPNGLMGLKVKELLRNIVNDH